MTIKSGYRGVSWDEGRGMWRAVLSDPWKHCGYYATEVQAAFAYDLEARKHGYRSDRLNFPRGLDADGNPL